MITGAVLTGFIGFFVVVTCAATLHRAGRSIEDAADAAVALRPLAGDLASALLAASVLPLSTAYSVCEYVGIEAAVDDSFVEARTFYLAFGSVTGLGALTVLIPNIPLVTVLVATQVLNAVLLVPILFAMIGIGRDRDLMGRFTIGPAGTAAYVITTAAVLTCVVALLVAMLTA